MDLAVLNAEVARSDSPLPGTALFIACDIVEISAARGYLAPEWTIELRRAAEHLQLNRHELQQFATLPEDLISVADAGELPTSGRLAELRKTLITLLRELPMEGSVPVDAKYKGF